MDDATYIDGEGGIWRLIDGRRELIGHDVGDDPSKLEATTQNHDDDLTLSYLKDSCVRW